MNAFFLALVDGFQFFAKKVTIKNREAFIQTVETQETTYSIPLSYRKMENLHIVFWLLKDISWCIVLKSLGIAMIFPTLIIAIIIAWRTIALMSELCHNLAITF